MRLAKPFDTVTTSEHMAASAKWWRPLETKSEVGPKLLFPGAVIQGGASVLGFPHRFTRFCIMSNKMFYKIKHGINTLYELTLQFGAAEVMHCAKFSHRRYFLAKQERKLHIKSFPEKRKKEVLLSVAVESWIWSAPAISSFWRLWRRDVASRGNAFWKSWQQLILLSKEERKLHNKSSADKELVAFILWEVLLLVGASLTQRVLLTRPWLQERRDLNVT